MLKPDAYDFSQVDEILNELTKNGIQILQKKEIDVTWDVMKTLIDHYQIVIEEMPKDFYFCGKMFNSFYANPCKKIMIIRATTQHKDDIGFIRKVIGATNPVDADCDTIRGKYSDDSYEKAMLNHRLVQNRIHASDSRESAKRELLLWSSYFEE